MYQMCVALVQSLFPPESEKALRTRVKTPMTRDEYHQLTEKHVALFSVDDPKYPFMQDRRTQAKELTPIQKLLPGLPAGDSSTFFVSAKEVERLCPSCAAIALFNQASCTPSFGGGFKAPLRGSAPLTVLIFDPSPRKRIWLNVLPTNSKSYAFFKEMGNSMDNEPVWGDSPIQSGSEVSAGCIGMLRGLFWQPASLKLLWKQEKGLCDCCLLPAEKFCFSFDKAKFKYNLLGFWPHPLSPRRLSKKNEYYVPSFQKEIPAWEHLVDILGDDFVSVPVIASYEKVYGVEKQRDIQLALGGYVNKQASILERRHERIPLDAAWLENPKKLRSLVVSAIEAKNALGYALSVFVCKMTSGKEKNFCGLKKASEKAFYQRTEQIMHSLLVEKDKGGDSLIRLQELLKPICMDILEESVSPWMGNISASDAYVQARNALLGKLNTIMKGLKPDSIPKTAPVEGGNSDGRTQDGNGL